MAKFCMEFNSEEAKKVKEWRHRHPYINLTQFIKALFFREINRDVKELEHRITHCITHND